MDRSLWGRECVECVHAKVVDGPQCVWAAAALSHSNYCLVFVGNVNNVARTLKVAKSGRFFQKLNICSVSDTCRSSSSPLTQTPLCSNPYPVASRKQIGWFANWLVCKGSATQRWSFLLLRRSIGSRRIESYTIYCRGMVCEKLDQNWRCVIILQYDYH